MTTNVPPARGVDDERERASSHRPKERAGVRGEERTDRTGRPIREKERRQNES